MNTKNDYSILQIENDTNSNPRYVVHFMAFVQDIAFNYDISVSEKYKIALSRCKKYYGKKYHNKKYGGGICFSTYNPEAKINQIIDDIEKEFVKWVTIKSLYLKWYSFGTIEIYISSIVIFTTV